MMTVVDIVEAIDADMRGHIGRHINALGFDSITDLNNLL